MGTEGDKRFKERYGHSALCRCIRRWRGRYIVTVRSCDCEYGREHDPRHNDRYKSLEDIKTLLTKSHMGELAMIPREEKLLEQVLKVEELT